MGKIKAHLARHKELYLGIGIGVGVAAVAGITCAIMKNNGRSIRINGTATPDRFVINGTGDNVLLNFGEIDTVSQTFVKGKTYTGYVVRCLETGLLYESQNEAAISMGITPSNLSKHLNGALDSVDGYHFERMHFVNN